MEDSYLDKGRRAQLISYLKDKIGIRDLRVLEAMNAVARHFFLESIFSEFAYEDRALPIASGQTISHPSTVAEQSELLCAQKGEKILEIGTGCGYQTAVLIHMGLKVYTVERQKELYNFSKKIFSIMNLQPEFQHFGDGFLGLKAYAPFDKILVTCGASILPIELLKQLKVGGIMVIPLGEGNEQTLYRFTKKSETEIEKEDFGRYSFVPMLGNTQM